MSDIFPTGYFGAEMAEIEDGDTVAVFGCGPVGLFAIESAKLLGAGRVFAIDRLEDRLQKARELGAECINFEQEDPVQTLRRLTDGIGPDRAIDAVGIDAVHAHTGAALSNSDIRTEEEESRNNVGQAHASGANWVPGDGPSQALQWAVEALAKAGTLSVIGVYPPRFRAFPIGAAMNKNLTVNMGNCHHRKYIPRLINLTLSGRVDPSAILTQQEDLPDALSAFAAFDRRDSGWIKVELMPEARAYH